MRMPIPPLYRQSTVILQAHVGGLLWAKALSTLLPAILSVSVFWQGSVYLVTLLPKWTFLSAWARITSEMLQTSHSQSRVRPSIIVTSLLALSLSFVPALLFLLFHFSFQLLFSCQTDLETSRHEPRAPGLRERQGHLERLTCLSFALTHRSLCSCFTPGGLCWRPETILTRSHCLILLSV